MTANQRNRSFQFGTLSPCRAICYSSAIRRMRMDGMASRRDIYLAERATGLTALHAFLESMR